MLTTNWIDAGYQGSRFTWCNNYEGAHCIRARLDRCLVNSAWSGAFPYWVVQHLSRALSDHAPFLVTYKESMNMEPRPFRYQHMWASHPSFLQMVRDSWNQPLYASPLCTLVGKLKRLKHEKWNREVFGNVFQRPPSSTS